MNGGAGSARDAEDGSDDGAVPFRSVQFRSVQFI
jgi:hypothetical protein